MASATNVIVGFVLSKVEGESVRKRAEIYRAIAQIVATNAEKKLFEQLAADCDAIDRAHEHFVFDFNQRTRE